MVSKKNFVQLLVAGGRLAGIVGVGLLSIAAGTVVTHAAMAVPYSSRVDGVITPDGQAYKYEFTVYNTTEIEEETAVTPVIVDWELPLFSHFDIDDNSIVSPEGWTYEIISSWSYQTANDPVLAATPDIYGPNPQVFETAPVIVHWFAITDDETGPTQAIYPGGALSGFGFVSVYASQNAPYLTSWLDLPPITGDPPTPGHSFGTPMSPARQQAQYGSGSVPEPTSFLLFAGLGIILWTGTSLRGTMGRKP